MRSSETRDICLAICWKMWPTNIKWHFYVNQRLCYLPRIHIPLNLQDWSGIAATESDAFSFSGLREGIFEWSARHMADHGNNEALKMIPVTGEVEERSSSQAKANLRDALKRDNKHKHIFVDVT
jgi:hypothetical protein